MKILLTENQYKRIFETVTNDEVICDECGLSWNLDVGGNDPYTCQECGHDNTPELELEPELEPEVESKPEPNVFSYSTLKEFVNPWRLKDPKRLYVNGLQPVKFDTSIPLDKIQLTKIDDSSQTFLINKDEFKQKVNKDNILKTFIDNNYFVDLSLPIDTIKTDDDEIGSSVIRLALEKTFKDNWYPKDNIFSAGIRGIYKLGDYLNTNEDWSILNYFDTKNEVKQMIYDELLKRKLSLNDLVTSVSILFKDKMFLDTIISRQLTSIVSGEETERSSIEKISKVLKTKNVTRYLPGSKMDRYNGVDVTINGVDYQIKPLKSYSTDNNGGYVVKTYGMNIKYLKKPIDKIAFCNDKEILIFDNKDYTVPFPEKVIFKAEPKIYK